MSLRVLLELLRLKTLTAAVVPVIAASTLAIANGYTVSPLTLSLILLSAVSIQVATNIFNDVIDFRKGVDNDERLGDQRPLQRGLLSESLVMALGFGFIALAVVTGLFLVLQAGVVILVIGVLSILLAYGYTGGPYPLAYNGLGDVFVVLFFGIIAVGGTYYIFTESYSLSTFILGLQIGLLATVLIAINNLRDIEGDANMGKRTLAVILGAKNAKREISALLYVPFALGLHWIGEALLAFALPLVLLLSAHRLSRLVAVSDPSTSFNAFLARGARLHLLFGLLVSAGFLLSV